MCVCGLGNITRYCLLYYFSYTVLRVPLSIVNTEGTTCTGQPRSCFYNHSIFQTLVQDYKALISNITRRLILPLFHCLRISYYIITLHIPRQCSVTFCRILFSMLMASRVERGHLPITCSKPAGYVYHSGPC